MTCAECRFASANRKASVYACHRHPPRVVVDAGKARTLYPLVNPSDWCGEWMRRPNVRQPTLEQVALGNGGAR